MFPLLVTLLSLQVLTVRKVHGTRSRQISHDAGANNIFNIAHGLSCVCVCVCACACVPTYMCACMHMCSSPAGVFSLLLSISLSVPPLICHPSIPLPLSCYFIK
mmetsp:Transcript_20958/g.34923  ORF Transcript_20958/g.34923 Transcript_20958/m.34923 type:complete len:104 (+) Transcript_20958:2-313(+)